MRKRALFVVLLLLAVALLSVGGVTLARYVKEMHNDDGQVVNPSFYFYGDLFTEASVPMSEVGAEIPEAIEVFGNKTDIHLYNSADPTRVSNVDFTYTLRYYVKNGENWVELETQRTTKTLSAESGRAEHTVTVSCPDGYDEVIVEAMSAAPYAKILRTRLSFTVTPFAVEKSYDREMGVISVVLSTNDDSGQYTLAWQEHVLPDNADPNGILTAGSAGADSVTVTLVARTTYRLYFFVSSVVRPELDALLAQAQANGQYDATIEQLLTDAVTVTYTATP